MSHPLSSCILKLVHMFATQAVYLCFLPPFLTYIVQDCTDETESCGGLASVWDKLYVSLTRCCINRKWWDKDCAAVNA